MDLVLEYHMYPISPLHAKLIQNSFSFRNHIQNLFQLAPWLYKIDSNLIPKRSFWINFV